MASSKTDDVNDVTDENVELWEMKKLIRRLDSYKGKITDELGAAVNIKSRENRQSVISALTSIQARLRLYNKTPKNGLVIFSGDIVDENNKEKKFFLDFEPLRPIITSSYLCDNKFHTETLSDALNLDDKKFGFIIVDGKGALFGKLHGNLKEVITKFDVDLPNKHGRGGQSSNRFAHIRTEKRQNYIRKVAESAVSCFIENDKINVVGLILAGSADLKVELGESDLFDQRLQCKILKYVDISYGGISGFNQAIDLAADCLRNVKYIQEKKLLGEFFDNIAKNTGLYCFGIEPTFAALEAGAVKSLIIWDQLNTIRYRLRKPDGREQIIFLNPEQKNANKNLIDNDTGKVMEVLDKCLLLDWIVENYKNYGAALHIITDNSQEGSQFCKGFGGFGGILRYEFGNSAIEFEDEIENFDYDDY